MRLNVPGFIAVAIAGLLTALAGCAQQPMLSAGTPLNGPVTSISQPPAVAGWQGNAPEPSGAVDTAAGPSDTLPGKPRSRAGRVLAAIALERVTGRSIDPARLAER